MSADNLAKARAAKAAAAEARKANTTEEAVVTEHFDIGSGETLAMVEEVGAISLAAETHVEAPEPKPRATKAPTMIEVYLPKKYAPFHLIGEDGELVEQGEVKLTVGPGNVLLEAKEARRVLERKQAQPTANTFNFLGD